MGEGESKPSNNTIETIKTQINERYHGLQEERENFKEKTEQLSIDGFSEYNEILRNYIIDTISLIDQLYQMDENAENEFRETKEDLEDMLVALIGSENKPCKLNKNTQYIKVIAYNKQNELQQKLRNDVEDEISNFSEFIKSHEKEECDNKYYQLAKQIKNYLCHYTREYELGTQMNQYAWKREEDVIENLLQRSCVGFRFPCSLNDAENMND